MKWFQEYKDLLNKERKDYLADAIELSEKPYGDVSWFIGFADGIGFALAMFNKMESENAKAETGG